MTTINGSSLLRVGGLASGMDTDSIVKQLMSAQKIPLDKLNQQKQLLEWKRDAYRDINSKLVDFRVNKISSYRSSTAMVTQKAVVSGNTDAVSAKAGGGANGVAMSVEVSSLATKETVKAANTLTAGGKSALLTTKLSDLASYNSSDFTAATSADGKTTYSATIMIKVGADTDADALKVDITSEDTVASVINKITSGTNSRVTAVYDEVSGQFSIKAKNYGENNDITVSGLSATLGVFTQSVKGASAKVTVTTDEGSQTYTPSSNTLTVNGVTLTLNSTNEGSPSKITTQSDPSTAVETIKSFVKDYNDLIATLNTKIGEAKYRDYVPLTDEQKKDMSEDDIKLWNEKAQSGLLKGDDILTSTISMMRGIITEALGGGSVNLASMGITTGQYFENGKLYVDEAKLTKAIESNPEGVTSFFQGTAATSTKSGLFNKFYDKLNGVLDQISKKAGTSKLSSDTTKAYLPESLMGKELKEYNKRISTLQDRLNDMETRYYKQFTAMEQALSNFNNQSASLTNFLNG
ncbi:flagellar filament capping protein FliD [Paenibacillus sp. JX-17]|uniref:Flagellar hook-associated protein 2 n=1 Tax=Paenibacillus lacisoli TaxID=3064525 RepID=A0ABT9CBD2_9BACL|nr:flagellar filament capping protein FliD [Paenibacillus sp. JX-17]MDO7906570.1 flagellar filament capping protein FliD [Paenibacillus sp. JX-17]